MIAAGIGVSVTMRNRYSLQEDDQCCTKRWQGRLPLGRKGRSASANIKAARLARAGDTAQVWQGMM